MALEGFEPSKHMSIGDLSCQHISCFHIQEGRPSTNNAYYKSGCGNEPESTLHTFSSHISSHKAN